MSREEPVQTAQAITFIEILLTCGPLGVVVLRAAVGVSLLQQLEVREVDPRAAGNRPAVGGGAVRRVLVHAITSNTTYQLR